MSSLCPATEVWEHGVLPLPAAALSEAALLALLDVPRGLSADLSISMEQWVALATERLGLSPAAAAACMRLCHVLSPAPGEAQAMPRDSALRVPLGSLLLLLWVQGAQRELQQGSAALGGKAQAVSGDVWPSLSLPPAAAASAGVGAGAPCARTLAVQARLGQQPSTQLPTTRQRRKMLQESLPTLLRLVGAGAERLYSHELDRLGLLLWCALRRPRARPARPSLRPSQHPARRSPHALHPFPPPASVRRLAPLLPPLRCAARTPSAPRASPRAACPRPPSAQPWAFGTPPPPPRSPPTRSSPPSGRPSWR